MERTRLDTLAPDLDVALRDAPAERRVSAGWLAARWAVDRTGLRNQAVDAALAGVAGEDLTALADDLDRRYFDLQEAAETDSATERASHAASSMARAVSAVAFAKRGEAVEAVYEAGHATGDWAGLRALLASELGLTAAAQPAVAADGASPRR
jgi:hypothetical protein